MAPSHSCVYVCHCISLRLPLLGSPGRFVPLDQWAAFSPHPGWLSGAFSGVNSSLPAMINRHNWGAGLVLVSVEGAGGGQVWEVKHSFSFTSHLLDLFFLCSRIHDLCGVTSVPFSHALSNVHVLQMFLPFSIKCLHSVWLFSEKNRLDKLTIIHH